MLDKLFVYGTLKNKIGAIRATTKGTLYSMGAFPALVLRGDNIVYGEVIPTTPQELAQLDLYEGVAFGLYSRETIVVDTEEGPIGAYVYVAGPHLIDSCTDDNLIESGEWHGNFF